MKGYFYSCTLWNWNYCVYCKYKWLKKENENSVKDCFILFLRSVQGDLWFGICFSFKFQTKHLCCGFRYLKASWNMPSYMLMWTRLHGGVFNGCETNVYWSFSSWFVVVCRCLYFFKNLFCFLTSCAPGHSVAWAQSVGSIFTAARWFPSGCPSIFAHHCKDGRSQQAQFTTYVILLACSALWQYSKCRVQANLSIIHIFRFVLPPLEDVLPPLQKGFLSSEGAFWIRGETSQDQKNKCSCPTQLFYLKMSWMTENFCRMTSFANSKIFNDYWLQL